MDYKTSLTKSSGEKLSGIGYHIIGADKTCDSQRNINGSKKRLAPDFALQSIIIFNIPKHSHRRIVIPFFTFAIAKTVIKGA